MKLDLKALAVTGAILWGGSVFLMGIANLVWAGYGAQFLAWLTFYPGYHAGRSFGQVVIVTVYAAFDGLFGAVIFGWLYNRLAKSTA